MLNWALVFFVGAVIAAIIDSGGAAVGAAALVRLLGLFIVVLLIGLLATRG